MADSPFPALQWQRLKASDEFQAYLESLVERQEKAHKRMLGISVSKGVEQIGLKCAVTNAEVESLEYAITFVDKKIDAARVEREQQEETAMQKVSRIAAMRWR